MYLEKEKGADIILQEGKNRQKRRGTKQNLQRKRSTLLGHVVVVLVKMMFVFALITIVKAEAVSDGRYQKTKRFMQSQGHGKYSQWSLK